MRKTLILVFSLLLTLALDYWASAVKVPAPERSGDGFKAVSLGEAQKLEAEWAVTIACHSHTTDYMKGHPPGTIHVTCLVPKDHKRTDLPLSEINFDVSQLPEDTSTPIITYCASNT